MIYEYSYLPGHINPIIDQTTILLHPKGIASHPQRPFLA